tara:strand:+ start:1418 stop:1684 length:267 start_codon:yes stop_codon:yes gene_type:complete
MSYSKRSLSFARCTADDEKVTSRKTNKHPAEIAQLVSQLYEMENDMSVGKSIGTPVTGTLNCNTMQNPQKALDEEWAAKLSFNIPNMF